MIKISDTGRCSFKNGRCGTKLVERLHLGRLLGKRHKIYMQRLILHTAPCTVLWSVLVLEKVIVKWLSLGVQHLCCKIIVNVRYRTRVKVGLSVGIGINVSVSS